MTESANTQAAVEAELGRLEADLRVLSPVGIERVAWGWDRHEADHLEAYHAAEATALRRLDEANLTERWDTWRRRLFYEVEGRDGLVAWKAERQRDIPRVHKAERAALGGALGVCARPLIGHEQYTTLVSALAEALPWLLPERPPSPTL